MALRKSAGWCYLATLMVSVAARAVDVTPAPEDPATILVDLRGVMYLLLSLAWYVFTLMLLRHASLTLKTVSGYDNSLASTGAMIGIVVGLVLGILWCGVLSDLSDVDQENAVLVHPRLFVPGALIASALPGALAALKFAMAATAPTNTERGRGAIWGGVVSVINFAASIATLISLATGFQSQ